MKIKNIKQIEKEDTYDLSINDNHNYIVSKSDICVHNSGKDSSKVDRSASYMARYIAKNAVAAGLADEMLVQISYAIGVAEPVSFYVNTYGTGKFSDDEIAHKLFKLFDLRPYSIIERFRMKDPIFKKTSAYGHFGRKSYESVIQVYYKDETTYTGGSGKTYKIVKYFGWEELNMVEDIQKEFLLI